MPITLQLLYDVTKTSLKGKRETLFGATTMNYCAIESIKNSSRAEGKHKSLISSDSSTIFLKVQSLTLTSSINTLYRQRELENRILSKKDFVYEV